MAISKAKYIEENGCRVKVIHLERVQHAKKQTLSEFELDRLSLTFKVLGDPNRIKTLMALRYVEMCVCDLAAFTGLSESAVSHQLRRLKDLCLVQSRRDGQVIYYSLDDEHVAGLIEIGLEHIHEQRTEVR